MEAKNVIKGETILNPSISISKPGPIVVPDSIKTALTYFVKNKIHILDIRPNDQYIALHVKYTCNVPWNELKDRMYELPHGHSQLVLIGACQDHIDHVKNYLTHECTKSNRKIIATYIWKDIISAMQNDPNQELHKNCDKCIDTTNNEVSKGGECMNHLQSDKENANGPKLELLESGTQYYRIWEPCVHLLNDIDYIESILTGKLHVNDVLAEKQNLEYISITDSSNTTKQDSQLFSHVYIPPNLSQQRRRTSAIASLKALDLGCGCGRDACWLVLERKWNSIIAVDFRTDRLGRVNKLATSMGVAESIQTLKVDVKREKFLDIDPSLKESLDMIYAIRFIHKPLLPHLGELLKEGGVIAYCQFYKGAEKFGSPSKTKDILQENEMRNIFKDWIIWMDEIRPCEDGRPLQWFIAQKPSVQSTESTESTESKV